MTRMRTLGITCAMALALAACSEEQDYAGEAVPYAEAEAASGATADAVVASGEESAGHDAAAIGNRPEMPLTLPRMAYVFDYGFRLPGAEIAALQIRHADMCEALGPTQCQIVGLTSSGDEDDKASGRLELAVATDRARGFVGELSAVAEGFHGEQVSAQITGEDLSRSMVDTEARLRSRTELRDRLMEVLETRRGTVEELVEAERSVAQINEELDQARSWMAEMRGRVAFSRVVLNYQSSTPAGSDFLGPVSAAFGSLGSILGYVLAVVIVLGGVVGPFLAAALGLRWWQRRHKAEAAAEG